MKKINAKKCLMISAAILISVFILGCATIMGRNEFHTYDQVHRKKTIFGPDDTILLEAILGYEQSDTKLTCKILKGSTTVYQEEYTTATTGFIYKFSIAASELTSKGGPGTYTVVWLLDGRQTRVEDIQLLGPAQATLVLFTARISDTKNPKEDFRHDEAIAIVVIGFAGKTVELYIRDVSTGHEVHQSTTYIPSNWPGLEQTVGQLPPGNYVLIGVVDGKKMDYKFLVR